MMNKSMVKNPEHRAWQVLSSEYLDNQPWFTVRKERVQLPTGVVVPEWYIFEFPRWVQVIAITKDEKFVMISQYRHGLGATNYELAAGVCEENEDIEQAARRELLEESGYGGGEWREFMHACPNPTNHNNIAYTFLAVGVERVSEQNTEQSEDIDVHLLSREEVRYLLDNNMIIHGLHTAPLWRWFAENR